MAADRENSFKLAERLLRQGKVQSAVEQLDVMVRSAPRDLLLLNRCGDLLARTDQPGIAIQFYERLADKYADGGFLPKAIAIYKKALKLDGDRAEVLVKLGELHMTQEHSGEARSYLLRAAERHLNDGEFGKARGVYERLVAAEPDDPRHRVRLAESRAAEGEPDRGGEELLALGHSLVDSGRPGDAERAYQRAGELLKDPFEATTGRAFSLVAQDRLDEALSSLDSSDGSREEVLCGVRAALLEIGGRADDAVRALEQGGPGETYETFLRWMLKGTRAQNPESAWERLDAAIESHGVSDELMAVLSRLSAIEADGHLPALERLYRLRRQQDDPEESVAALERLIRGLRARSRDADAERFLAELKEIRPQSAVLESEAPEPSEVSEPDAVPEAVSDAAPMESAGSSQPSPEDPAAVYDDTEWVESEAPAVPLTPADDEFVKGHLTEAEVLQKYGLASEALQRLRTVTGKFPGYVEGQVRLAALVRAQGNRSELAEVLFRLALARRAAGDTDGAREAARGAGEQSPLPTDQEELLRRLGLIAPRPTPSPEPVESTEPDMPIEAVEETRTGHATAEATPEDGDEEEDQDVEIVFGAEPAEAEPAEDEPAVSAEVAESAEPSDDKPVDKVVRLPPADVLEEIRFYREQGMVDEANGKLAALRTLGYGGADVEALESQFGTVEAEKPAPVVEDGAGSVRLGDGDLTDLTAALQADVTTDGQGATSDGGEGEESLEEVFAAFKRQVEDEVGSEDFRTHYDLGIAYKEMGLLNDALKEFEVASGSPELFREACSMAALCQRQRGEIEEAVGWYQKALEVPGGTPEELQGLQYDLADVLLQQGDDQGALDLFQAILDGDPGYRDVLSRVTDLQARRGS